MIILLQLLDCQVARSFGGVFGCLPMTEDPSLVKTSVRQAAIPFSMLFLYSLMDALHVRYSSCSVVFRNRGTRQPQGAIRGGP